MRDLEASEQRIADYWRRSFCFYMRTRPDMDAECLRVGVTVVTNNTPEHHRQLMADGWEPAGL